MTRQSPIFLLVFGLLVLVLALAGCVARYTPEQAPSLTATAASYLVPTPTPRPPATATTAAQPRPSPTAATASPVPAVATASPVPTAVPATPVSSLPVGSQPGQVSPDFTLDDAQGQALSLSSFRGQPVLMVFWASWCGHCQNEMPLLQNAYEKYGPQGLVILGVSVPGLSGETKEKALAFVDEKGIKFPILFDEQAQTFGQYGVSGVPNLIFIDRHGVVVDNHAGEMAEAQLADQITQMLEAQ
jgi:peroxiredoxin